jgi:hypothetical protein
MNNFFNTQDLIVSMMMLLWLIPTYLIYRSAISLFYKTASRFGWNLQIFSADQVYLKSLKLFYYARLLPNPFWDDEQKEKWASSWWIYGLVGSALFYLQFELSMLI